jgi:hypothetical protein
MFLKIFHVETPKIIDHIPWNPRLWKQKKLMNKETVFSARRLLQHFQLPAKKFRDISWYVYKYFVVFENIYVFHIFSRNP